MPRVTDSNDGCSGDRDGQVVALCAHCAGAGRKHGHTACCQMVTGCSSDMHRWPPHHATCSSTMQPCTADLLLMGRCHDIAPVGTHHRLLWRLPAALASSRQTSRSLRMCGLLVVLRLHVHSRFM